MNPEFFMLILVIGIASGLIYAVSISKWRKDKWMECNCLGD